MISSSLVQGLPALWLLPGQQDVALMPESSTKGAPRSLTAKLMAYSAEVWKSLTVSALQTGFGKSPITCETGMCG